jgi:hypothetical protein
VKRRNNAVIRYLKEENKKRPAIMTPVDPAQWPEGAPENLQEAWINSKFLAQVYREDQDVIRVSVCRTMVLRSGKWKDEISWEELMEVKRQIGRGDRYAVEVLPADDDIINVANFRHLWITPKPLVGWRRPPPEKELNK